jgi:hypothetical protein
MTVSMQVLADVLRSGDAWRRKHAPETYADVLRRRFCKSPPDTLHAIGADLGLTRESVRQLERVALHLLRHPSRRQKLCAAVPFDSELRRAIAYDHIGREEWEQSARA